VTVKWSGPNGRGDYITVTRKGSDTFAYLDYKMTSDGRAPVNPVSLVLPAEPGTYEIRYVTGAPRRVLATVLYEVTAVTATIEGPAAVAPDARFEVAWSGPNNHGDFVTIVAVGAALRTYGSYVDARIGRTNEKTGRSVATLRAPTKPGQYELRYLQQGSRIIGTRAIAVTSAVSSGSAPGGAASPASGAGATSSGAAGASPAAATAAAATGAGGAAASGAAAISTGAAGASQAQASRAGAGSASAAAGAASSPSAGSASVAGAGAAPAGGSGSAASAGSAGAASSSGAASGAAAGSGNLSGASAAAAATPATQPMVSPGSPSTAVGRVSTGRAPGTLTELKVASPGGPPVGGLRVRTISPREVALQWSCVQGSTGYEVFSAMNGGESVKITPTPLNPNCVQDLTQINPARLAPGSAPTTTYSTGFSHWGLTPGNNYTYVVRALYANGGPADSPPVAVRLLFPAPAFTPRPANPGQVSIHWEWSHASGDYAPGYVISRRLAGESGFRQLATIPYDGQQNVYNDNGVPVGSHQYLVEAVDGEKGTPVTVTTGVVSLWGAGTERIVVVDLAFSGVWPGGSVRVLSAPSATGPFTDITAEGNLSEQHWFGVAQFGSNLHYKVVVSYPNGITHEAVARVAVPQASNIGLVAEDAGGGARLKWNCETGVARYQLLRRVGVSGPFKHVGPDSVVPTPGRLGGAPTCSYLDTTVPLGNNAEWVVIGFSTRQQGDNPIRAARTMAFIKAWP
jgi:hypothetical protein